MAIVLNNKISGTVHDGTNSYVDMPYADDYFANHWNVALNTAWGALGANQKLPLLVAACRTLEQVRFTVQIVKTDWRFHRYYNRLTMQIMNFQLLREPCKFYFYQQLQFPRNLDIDPISGVNFIPENVLMAQCEQAAYMLTFDQTALANRIQGITQDTISIGRGQIHMSQQYGYEGSMIAPAAFEMVKNLVVRGQKLRRS